MPKAFRLLVLVSSLPLTACGPSPTLTKYSDAQIERCQRSLSAREIEAARAKAEQAVLIPFVGGLVGRERYIEELEAACKRKGIL